MLEPGTIAILVLALGCAGLFGAVRYWRRRYLRATEDLSRQLETQRAAADRALQQARDRLTAWFDSLPEAVLVVDQAGRIQLANRPLRQLLHLPADLAGRPAAEVLPAQDLAQFWSRPDEDRVTQEVEISLPREGEKFFEVNAAPILAADGQRQGTILALHDLTRVRQLEKTRQDFVANVSHELRTPLSLIKGFVETLLDGAIHDPEVAVRFLRNVEKHANRLVFLIEDLLTISRLESRQVSLNRQNLRLHQLAQRVFEDLESRALEKSARLVNQVPPGLSVWADADRLQQVLWNLVENAIKYGRSEGTVTVGARPLEHGPVEIWVKDDGPGIPPEARDRIFERFYRADRARSRETGGTGLGLSIVKHIIQAHGGEVWVQSAVQRGTTFYFTLPPALQTEPGARTPEADAEAS